MPQMQTHDPQIDVGASATVAPPSRTRVVDTTSQHANCAHKVARAIVGADHAWASTWRENRKRGKTTPNVQNNT